jgi:DNA helicase II / ATP-dependent DNA helicase PcrA
MGSLGDMETLEDDLWPLTGEDNEVKEEENWEVDSGFKERNSKRRRLRNDVLQPLTDLTQTLVSASHITTSTTTMQRPTSFSIASTTMSAGFVSAVSYLQDLDKGKPSSAASEECGRLGKQGKPSQVVDHMTQDLPLKAAGVKAFKRSRDQPSLRSFLAKPVGDKKDLHAEQGSEPPRPKPTTKIGPPEEPRSSTQQTASMHRLPQPAIPLPLANHRPRATPLLHIPSQPPSPPPGQKHKPYVFFSSPPSEKAHREESKPESPLRKKVGIPVGGSDVRPAKGLHMPSAAQIQATSSSRCQRRTLGVRRSLNGWTSRANQGHGFVVPGRKQS